MPIEFRCPLGHRLGAPDHYAGKKIRCPVCREKVRIPRPAAAPQPPAEPSLSPQGQQTSAPESPPESPAVPEPVATAAPSATTSYQAAWDESPPDAEHSLSPAVPGTPQEEEPAREQTVFPPQQEPSVPEEIIVLSDRDDPAWWTIYRPDPGKVQSARMLALAMAVTCVVGAVPGAVFVLRGELPGWAVVVLGLAAFQLLYLVWMASLPDWSTVWIGMVVFAASGAFYGAVTAWLLFTPPDRPLPWFDVEEVRRQALGWSVANLTLCTLVTYAAGRLAARWRLADQIRFQSEQEKREQRRAVGAA